MRVAGRTSQGHGLTVSRAAAARLSDQGPIRTDARRPRTHVCARVGPIETDGRPKDSSVTFAPSREERSSSDTIPGHDLHDVGVVRVQPRRPGGAHRRGQVPRGPLLSPQRHPGRAPAASRAPRRHSRARRAIPRRSSASDAATRRPPRRSASAARRSGASSRNTESTGRCAGGVWPPPGYALIHRYPRSRFGGRYRGRPPRISRFVAPGAEIRSIEPVATHEHWLKEHQREKSQC
jgi:hypothetical protein